MKERREGKGEVRSRPVPSEVVVDSERKKKGIGHNSKEEKAFSPASSRYRGERKGGGATNTEK